MILVTGGEGNLATELKKLCSSVSDVRFETRENFNVLDSEQMYNYFAKYQVNKVIHMASYNDVKSAGRDQVEAAKCVDINTIGTSNLVNICNKRNVPIVFISSYYVYENCELPFTEMVTKEPTSVYAKSKYY